MVLTTGKCVFDDMRNEYILDDVIGNGGFGVVYKAHRKTDNAIFAVKTILSDVGGEESYIAFENEIALTKGIESENVIKYLFTHSGTQYPELPPYIIMEYAPDGTLFDLLSTAQKNNQLFSVETIHEIYKQLINGMKVINSVLVHRDIKPQNILRCNGIFKISDFGLSKFASESTRSKTLKGYGTYLYIAPEGWRYEQNTIQMDIYAMGIVFYQIATLQYPYKNIDPSSDIEMIRNAHLASPVDRRCLDSNLPQNIVSVILRMLEKSVDRRYKNWDDIMVGLETPKIEDPILKCAIEDAVKQTLTNDLLKQEKTAALLAEKRKILDFKRIVMYQFEESVFEPLNNFVQRHNSIYQGSNTLTITKSYDVNNLERSDKFNFHLLTPFKTKIDVAIEIVRKENYTRKNYYDRVFEGDKFIIEHYIPECEHRKVLAWGYIQVPQGNGYNLLLLQKIDSEDQYGDWFILENHPSAFAKSPAEGPLAAEFNEIEKVVNDLHAMSLVDSTLQPFSAQRLYDFVTTCISQDKYKV